MHVPPFRWYLSDSYYGNVFTSWQYPLDSSYGGGWLKLDMMISIHHFLLKILLAVRNVKTEAGFKRDVETTEYAQTVPQFYVNQQ